MNESKINDLEAHVEFLENRITDLETKISEQLEKLDGNGREIRHLQDELTAANNQKKIVDERLKQVG